ncbi:agmatinase, mitochondrial [Nephila pilipes]|uniref:Agmatinase, mitochondrial n=1 Tax=Nephila pilipes TaxID=299642 RepID=A0A8X6TC75_NEPPI|nr:agmatinase, mitochondrial [Nephila pilipes]
MFAVRKALQNGFYKNFVRQCSSRFNQPLSAHDVPFPGGISTFMRLPYQKSAEGLDVGIIGVPMDIGTSNRSGARFGPRQIRQESSLLRPCCASTGDEPFETLQVADLGDIPYTLYDITRAAKDIKDYISNVLQQNCIPITLGGDHTITFPILQAIKEKHGPVGLLHIDAHADVSDSMMDCKISHETPFRRAFENGALDPKRVVQIGLRGTTYTAKDYQWSADEGFRVILAQDCWHKCMTPVMEDIRKQLGNGPVYVSLDIDSLDPCYAPGTGTPEIGGLTTIQLIEIIRGLQGVQLVGGDVVEVAPPYDLSGNTSLTAANLVFEFLSVLAKNKKGLGNSNTASSENGNSQQNGYNSQRAEDSSKI